MTYPDEAAVEAAIMAGQLTGEELGELLDRRAAEREDFEAAMAPALGEPPVAEVRFNAPTHVSEEHRRHPDGHYVIPPPDQGDG